MIKFIIESLRVSFFKTWTYKFEYIMILFHLIFNFIFILIFWIGIVDNFVLPNNYSSIDLFLYSGLMMFAGAINEVFFAVNTLPYSINGGDLDMFLIRPRGMILTYVLQNINIIAVLESMLISIVFLVAIYFRYDLVFILNDFVISIFLIIVGAVVNAMFFGILSMLSFWFGITSNLRNMIYTLSDFQKYPLGFFSTQVQNVFVYIIPLGFLSRGTFVKQEK